MMKKQVLLALAALAVSGAAAAQGYGVVSVGSSRLDDDCAGTTSCDKNGTAFKLLGGYKFAPNFAAEGGYFDFGKATFSVGSAKGSIKTNAFGGGVAFHTDFAPSWAFVARLGLASVKSKADLAGVSVSESNAQLYAGLGLGYKLNKSTSVDGTWETTTSEIQGGKSNVHAFSIGLTFGF